MKINFIYILEAELKELADGLDVERRKRGNLRVSKERESRVTGKFWLENE